MRIVMIASEAAPYCTGRGAGEVLRALPRALAERGHRLTVLLPLHREMKEQFAPVEIPPVVVRLHDGTEDATILRAEREPPGVEVFAVGADRYFDRPGLYGEGGADYADSVRRFAFFCRAALGAIVHLGIEPDVLHCHDWPTALIPVYLRGGILGQDDAARAPERLGVAAVVLTVHDPRAQGIFPSPDFAAAGVPRGVISLESIESHGTVNLLREGLERADHITTVGPRYARDLRTPEYGAGLEDLFEARAGSLTGILNAVDPSRWNPADDPHLVTSYGPSGPHGKRRCKADLLVEMDLDAELDTPVAGVLSPLEAGQGFDVLLPALSALFERGLRLAVLGEGDARFTEALRERAAASERRLAFVESPSEALTHKVLAGSDLLLMPSRYEACGFAQMAAQVYGTVPIVRAVGGLADTVLDLGAVPLRGTGFWIGDDSREALVEAVDRALAAFAEPDVWAALRARGMRRDFSWRHAAARYVQLYRRLVQRSMAGPRAPRLETGRWHGRVADDFTLDAVRATAQGVAEALFEEEPSAALVQRGLLVAHDTRLLGADVAEAAAGVLAWNDIAVARSVHPTTLPAVACAVRAAGLAGALVVTAEASSARWNGIHLIGPLGAPASRDATAVVDGRSSTWTGRAQGPEELGAREATELGLRREIDPDAIHREVLEAVVHVDAIRTSGLRVACDLGWGATRGTLDRLLGEWGVGGDVVHEARDPTFGGGRPEPTPEGLAELAERVLAGHDLGVAVDPSGSRFGIVDRGGEALAADHVLALVLDHLAETRGAPGRTVGRSVATSRLIDSVAVRRGLKVIETPTGFQELGALLGRGDAFFAVDANAFGSSTAAPHADGVLAALLVVEMIAYRRRSLGSQLEELFGEAGRVVSRRRRVALSRGSADEVLARLAAPPEQIGGSTVRSVVALDGARIQLDGDAWIHARLDEQGSVLQLAAEAETAGAAEALLDAAQELFVPGMDFPPGPTIGCR